MTRIYLTFLLLAFSLQRDSSVLTQGLESGLYKMTVLAGTEGPVFVSVERKGSAIFATELSTRTAATGEVRAGSTTVELAMTVPEANVTGIRVPTQAHGLNLSGAQLRTANAGWVAANMVKIPTVWQCSNHNPIHVVESDVQMKEYTKDKQCDRWKPVK